MRIAALIFGLLAGLLGSGIIALGSLVGGLAAAGVFGSHADFAARFLLYAIPNLGLLGAGVALARPRIGGLLLLASAAAWVAVAIVAGHGAVLFAALPFTFAGAGGLVALFAGRESAPEPEAEPAVAAPRWPEAARFEAPERARTPAERGEPAFDFAPAPAKVAQEAAWKPSAEDYVDADPMFEGPPPPEEAYPYEEQAEVEPPPEETYAYEEAHAAEPLPEEAYPYEEEYAAAPEETPPDTVLPEHEFDFTADFRAAREAEAAAAAYAEPEPTEPEAEAAEPEPHEPEPHRHEPEPEQWAYPHAPPTPPPEPAPRYAAERRATPSRRAAVSPARRRGGQPTYAEPEAESTPVAGGSVPPPEEADYQDVEPYDPEAPVRRRAGGPLRGLLRLLVLGLFLVVVGGILTALYVDYQSGSHSLLLGGQDGQSSPPPSPVPDQPPVNQPAAQHAAPPGDNPIQLAPSPATTLQWSAATPDSPVPVPALPGAAPGATEAAPPAVVASPPATPGPDAASQAAAVPVAEPDFADPFAYCAAVGTIDAPDQRFTGPAVPPAIAAALQAPAAADSSQVRWRCVDRSVLACRADHTAACDLTPTVDAMIAYCAQHPDAQDIPAPNGYWACNGTRPVIPRDQKWPVDARGFYPEAWTRVPPPAAG